MKRNVLIFFIIAGFFCLACFLGYVFTGVLTLPQFFMLGPITIHSYGIIMALAVASAFYLAIKRAPIYGIQAKLAEDLLFWIIIGGFIGARLYHVLSSVQYYSLHPVDVFKVWNGGLSIFGAVIGGFITLMICKKILNFKSVPPEANSPRFAGEAGRGGFKILNLLDWLAPSLLVGQIIGRFGNLFNYEAFGYPANLPWKMFVPLNFRPENYQNFNYFHPWFLYEALGNLIILIFLLLLFQRDTGLLSDPIKAGSASSAKATEGKLFFSYLLLYNALRFGLEFLRIDSTFIGLLRLNSISSLVLVFVSIIALVFIRKDAQAP